MHYIGCNKRFTLRTVWSEDIACLSCLARALGASCKGNCSLVCSSSPSWQPYSHHWSGNSSTHQARGVRCHCLLLLLLFSLICLGVLVITAWWARPTWPLCPVLAPVSRPKGSQGFCNTYYCNNLMMHYMKTLPFMRWYLSPSSCGWNRNLAFFIGILKGHWGKEQDPEPYPHPVGDPVPHMDPFVKSTDPEHPIKDAYFYYIFIHVLMQDCWRIFHAAPTICINKFKSSAVMEQPGWKTTRIVLMSNHQTFAVYRIFRFAQC